MPSPRAALLVGNAAVALGVLATTRERLPDATLAYVALALAAAFAWPRLRRRRLTTLLLASAGAWSTFTGILLVYVVPALPQGGRALRWWHAVTSTAMLLAFLAHWARNSTRLVGLAQKLRSSQALFAITLAAWGALALAALSSLRPPARALFDDGTLGLLTAGALGLAGAGVLYGAAYATSPGGGPRIARARDRIRGAVDASLLAAMWLATLTGFPLQYLARPLRAADAYWLLTGWHVLASVLLLGLVAGHVAFNRKPLAAHAR